MAFVGEAYNAAFVSSMTLSYSSTTGNCLALAVLHQAGAITSVVDSNSATWTQTVGTLAANTATGAARVAWYVRPNNAAITSVTVTMGGTSALELHLVEESGMLTTSVVRASATDFAATGTPLELVNADVAANTNDVILGVIGYGQGASRLDSLSGTGNNAGYTSLPGTNVSTSWMSVARKVAGTTATQGPRWTYSASPGTHGQATIALIPTSVNAAPTVTAPANQEKNAGDTATFTFAESDDVGVVSRTTTFDYPLTGAPTVTNPGSATSSFTVGAAGSLYIVRRRVTDAGGLFAEATMEIRVPLAATGSELRPLSVVPSGTWTVTGGTTAAVLSDESDATYLESPPLSATAVLTGKMREMPSVDRTAGTWSIRAAKTDSGTATLVGKLYAGVGSSTVLDTWTITTLTTSPATYTRTLAGGTITAITAAAGADGWELLHEEWEATT